MLVSLSFVSSETRESRITTSSESLFFSELLESALGVVSLFTTSFFPFFIASKPIKRRMSAAPTYSIFSIKLSIIGTFSAIIRGGLLTGEGAGTTLALGTSVPAAGKSAPTFSATAPLESLSS